MQTQESSRVSSLGFSIWLVVRILLPKYLQMVWETVQLTPLFRKNAYEMKSKYAILVL